MKMSITSIDMSLRATKEAIRSLEDNLKWTESSVIGEVSQIHEPAADKCMQEMESFKVAVQSAIEDLKHIQDLLEEHKRFYDMMNNG